MKKRVFVLDVFTFGHEVALLFVKKQGWSSAEFEIIFCGSHRNVLKRLIEGPAYAVVPIRNSTTGEFRDVTTDLARYQKTGYDLIERDRFDLPIKLCLLAPKNVDQAEDLKLVISHKKAIDECNKYLDAIGTTPNMRISVDSVGEAARFVSKLGPDALVGVIAPKSATQGYGLKILAYDVQDAKDDMTTFILLQHECKR